MKLFLLVLFAGLALAQYQPPSGGGGGSGTVTSVTCGTGLAGGTITTTGTCDLNLALLTANQGLWDGSQATRTITFEVTGTDPVMTFSASTINISTGVLQVGGVGVVVASSPGVGLAHFAGSTQVVTSSLVVSADLNITTTSCMNQFLTAIGATGLGTCTTVTLAGAQFANQGTTTTILHGNAAGNPSFGSVVNADIAAATIDLTAKVTGVLPAANGGGQSQTVADRGWWPAGFIPGSGAGIASGIGFTSLQPRVQCFPNPFPSLKVSAIQTWLSVGDSGKSVIAGIYDPATDNLVTNGASQTISLTSTGQKRITWSPAVTFTGPFICFAFIVDSSGTAKFGTSDTSTVFTQMMNQGTEPQVFTIATQGSLALPASMGTRTAASASSTSIGMYVQP